MLTLCARVDPALGVAVGWNHFVSIVKDLTFLAVEVLDRIADMDMAISVLRLAMSSSRPLSSTLSLPTGDMTSRQRYL